TSVGVAGRVGVVLEEVDLAADAFLTQALLGAANQALEVPLPCLVVHDQVGDGVTLGRRVLGVAADVEIEPRAVLEERVARTTPRHDAREQVPGAFVGAQAALAAQRAGDSVLVLEPEDPPFHAPQPTAAPSRRSEVSRSPVLLQERTLGSAGERGV